MRCQFCNEREATIHYTEVISGNVKKIHICQECAASKGIDASLPFSFSDILTALSQGIAGLQAAESDGGKTCPLCNLGITALLKHGRLGCPQCYEVFASTLDEIIRQVQKAPRHAGKVPERFLESEDIRQRIARLEQSLQEAVREERYEDCVPLRDELRRLRAAQEAEAGED
jgi:protein arginine kinase activator